MIVAVAGATGFVGRALTAQLLRSGHDVVALGRSVNAVSTDARAIAVDVGDECATTNALAGVEAAYYLVHSMAAGGGFRAVDLRLATGFGRAAAKAGVGRIIYVGALGNAPSSAHLASRHEVGSALAASGVAVIELRAAVVFGSGSISFEMLRYLTERLPAMVCPRWVRTRIQPIALVDLLAYLEQSLQVAPGIYEIGGADVTTYREMISAYASVRGLRPRRIIDIPWLTPQLSSYWVDLVTPVDRSVSHALIESLVTEVVVMDPEPARRAFSVTPMGVERALAAALNDQDEAVSRSLFDRRNGLVDGVYCIVVDVAITSGTEDSVVRDLGTIGGRLSWYGAAAGWMARLALGRLVGEHLRRRRPAAVMPGALVDWWRIIEVESGELVLRSVGWFPGDAWLGYRAGQGVLHQIAAFRPRGIPGFLYWKLLAPVHRLAFARMARRRVSQASAKV
ncbi:MAG TPA: DUF2867 domain-containing protein [Acidimicrobiales bacterium]|nr:DUF2867 domain-containing protein [Acidimicrobiales bacterium]HVA05425.1 DUF2867 domain-containing protein [Acidimicrobiales bacterium]